MMFWLVLFAAIIILSAAGMVFLVRQIHRFGFMQKYAEKHRKMSWVLSAGILSLTGLFLLINSWAFMIVILHLALIWLICRGISAVIGRLRKKPFRGNPEGAAAILLTAVYLTYGWYEAHTVQYTHYDVTTAKSLPAGEIRIAEIADLHIGLTLDGDEFSDEVGKLRQNGSADLVVITGDFVDDSSLKSDMLKACEALGSLETEYGIYYISGNHDRGYGNYRDFSYEELTAALESSGVTVLEDESVLTDGGFYVTGRKDKSADIRGDGRMEMSELDKDLDMSKYQIVLDHQPNDYSAEAEANADLVLSGHTHGGHIFPAGYIGVAIGANDRAYGCEMRGDTAFIVSSGISGWAIPFKTGTVSEIVIIDVRRGENAGVTYNGRKKT